MADAVSEKFVRRYLLSHNYSRTLAALEAESSSDNLNERPSKIVDSISQAIIDLDHVALERIWKGLEDCFSSRLSRQNVLKFESFKAYTYKTLLCEAVKSQNLSYVNTFFTSQVVFDLCSPTWNNWSVLPFIKEPAKHGFFSRYFTKAWPGFLFMSLSNFLCALFTLLPVPSKNDLQSGVAVLNSTQFGLPRINSDAVDDFSVLSSTRVVKPR